MWKFSNTRCDLCSFQYNCKADAFSVPIRRFPASPLLQYCTNIGESKGVLPQLKLLFPPIATRDSLKTPRTCCVCKRLCLTMSQKLPSSTYCSYESERYNADSRCSHYAVEYWLIAIYLSVFLRVSLLVRGVLLLHKNPHSITVGMCTLLICANKGARECYHDDGIRKQPCIKPCVRIGVFLLCSVSAASMCLLDLYPSKKITEKRVSLCTMKKRKKTVGRRWWNEELSRDLLLKESYKMERTGWRTNKEVCRGS